MTNSMISSLTVLDKNFKIYVYAYMMWTVETGDTGFIGLLFHLVDLH